MTDEKYDVPVQILLTRTLREQVRAEAKSLGLGTSAFIRMLIIKHFETIPIFKHLESGDIGLNE